MKPGFDANQRAALKTALAADGPTPCPACGADLVRNPVPPRGDVAYVRRRVLLVCSACGRSAAIDLPRTTDR